MPAGPTPVKLRPALPDPFDIRRIRPAELLALLAGAGLLVDLFLPWYSFTGGSQSAWTALTVIDLLLALAALHALALFGAALLARTPGPPIALGVCLVPVGLVATLAALFRLLDPPGGAHGTDYGAPVGFVAATLILVAAWRSIGDERPARGFPVREEQR